MTFITRFPALSPPSWKLSEMLFGGSGVTQAPQAPIAQSATICALPDDVLVNILLLLDMRDLMTCKQVRLHSQLSARMYKLPSD